MKLIASLGDFLALAYYMWMTHLEPEVFEERDANTDDSDSTAKAKWPDMDRFVN
jgi:hypothetical protein